MNPKTISEFVFVFGSNLSGRHGAGAALYARQNHGAIYGQGVGRQGNSYAIPTKNADVSAALPLSEIEKYVKDFKKYAENNPELHFQVTRIGCGLAGFTDEQISPMFKDSPKNCHLPVDWKP